MTRWIQTADDGAITEIVDETPTDDGEWIEITELAYMSDAAPDGKQSTHPNTPGARGLTTVAPPAGGACW